MKITRAEYEVLTSLRTSLEETLAKARHLFGAGTESYALVLEQFSPVGVPSGRSLYPIVDFKDEANKATYDKLVASYNNSKDALGSPELDEVLGMMLAEGLIVAFTEKEIYGITSFGLTVLRDATIIPNTIYRDRPKPTGYEEGVI